MKRNTLFLTLLFLMVCSVAMAQTGATPHPVEMQGKDCAICHAPGSTEEITADPAAYTEWSNSLHGLNNVSCLTCHGDESTFKADSDINTCLSCHPQEATVINAKVNAGSNGLICTSCHSVHNFTAAPQKTKVHSK